MRKWREVFKKLVTNNNTEVFPLCVFKANSPSQIAWPNDLVSSPIIQKFYSICDGGYFDHYTWEPVSKLSEVNKNWADLLNLPNDYIIDLKFNLVLGTDAAGAPLIWDARTDEVATFWFRGGGWEPLANSLELFLASLVNPKQSDELWYEALAQLDGINQ